MNTPTQPLGPLQSNDPYRAAIANALMSGGGNQIPSGLADSMTASNYLSMLQKLLGMFGGQNGGFAGSTPNLNTSDSPAQQGY